jgi:hypothetical protein
MDDLGGVTDKKVAAQMESLAENEVSDSGEDIIGEDSDYEESFYGRVAHNPVAPEFKAGARVAYLGQEGGEMHVQYIVAVHLPPFYTAYLEGLGEKRGEGQRRVSVADQEDTPPPVSIPVSSHSFSRVSQAKKEKKGKEGKEGISQADV